MNDISNARQISRGPAATTNEANERRHDPITLEILSNALRSAMDEAFVALMKSAHSTNIKERNDHSTAIFDRDGRLIVQAKRSLPVHIGSITGTVLGVLRRYAGDINEGDVFIGNDPYEAQGSHLPDVNMVAPVFVAGELVGFSSNVAHHADIGGMVPGSMAGGMSEVYQEGVRIPVVRLIEAGVWNNELFEILLLNVRAPKERRGDYFAQLAACKFGESRLHEIFARYDTPFVLSAFAEILRRTERRIRDSVAQIRDGEYVCVDVMDDDGVAAKNIPIRLVIRKSGNRIVCDFTGSARQVAGNINLTLNATVACVCFALQAMLDPESPSNQGVISAVDVIAEPGSIVNCVFPAAVAQRSQTCQRIVDMVLACLAEALPERAVGGSNGANTTAVFSGVDPRTNQTYVYLETLGGGVGGRFDHDGKDGVQANMTNTSNLPVEAIETEYPLRVDEYSLIADSGGPGRYRGGMGLRRVITPVGHVCVFNGAGERFSNAPRGIFGGGEAAMGSFHLAQPEGLTKLPAKCLGITIPDQAGVVIETPGGGGYGDPSTRSGDDLRNDFASAKFSKDFLSRHYVQGAGTEQGGTKE